MKQILVAFSLIALLTVATPVQAQSNDRAVMLEQVTELLSLIAQLQEQLAQMREGADSHSSSNSNNDWHDLYGYDHEFETSGFSVQWDGTDFAVEGLVGEVGGVYTWEFYRGDAAAGTVAVLDQESLDSLRSFFELMSFFSLLQPDTGDTPIEISDYKAGERDGFEARRILVQEGDSTVGLFMVFKDIEDGPEPGGIALTASWGDLSGFADASDFNELSPSERTELHFAWESQAANLLDNFMDTIDYDPDELMAWIEVSREEAPVASVLESLQEAREAGEDASIKMLLANMRSQAEISYDDNDRSYSNVCTDGASLLQGIEEYSCVDSNTRYLVQAELSDQTYWCIDSTGVATERESRADGFACEE